MLSTHETYVYTDSISYSRNTIECLCGGDNLVCPENYCSVYADMSTSSFMSITQLVGITQFLSDAAMRGIVVRLGKATGAIENYLARMNLFQILGIENIEQFNRHAPHGNFVPMIKLDSDEKHQYATDLIRDVVIAHLADERWDPGTILDVSMSEVMGNIPVHAQSDSYGIVGAQYYPKSRIVEICVADSGRGIVASMSDNPDYVDFDREQIMSCALEEGYGQYYGRKAFSGPFTSAGRGLMFPTRLVRALNGRMWIVSHNDALEVSGKGIEPIKGLFYPGTLISIRLPVEQNGKVFASQIFTGAPNTPITWNPQEGWVNQDGDQVDVFQLRGTETSLW